MNERILIIEDNFLTSDEISERLKIIGYNNIEIALNSKEAITKAAYFKPDIILADINLGDSPDGIETINQINKDRGMQIPVIFMTAYDDDDTLERIKITKPYGYIIKPIHERDLKIALSVALEKIKWDSKIKKSEARLKSIFDTTLTGFCIIDLQGVILFMNKSTEEIHGYSVNDLLGKHLKEIIHPESINCMMQGLNKLLSKDINRIDEEIKLSHNENNDPVWVHYNAVRYDNLGKEEFDSILFVFKDITEQKILESGKEKRINEIKKLNESLLSSINYAHKIQKAVLPNEKLFKHFIGENFILYLPKDIVSGDFYWIRQHQHKVFIAVADCTGHGVPGAFMSMLGTTLLNTTLDRSKPADSYQANKILNTLRKNLKKELKNEYEKKEVNDGMDMAFCIIDLENFTMQYAGAYNPLVIVREIEGEYTLIEHKADRMPIGPHIIEHSFKNNHIQLLKDDIVYMYSDGFQDQFSEKDKKYTKKRFRNFLLSIANKPMKQQKILLHEEFTRWKGNSTQTDDILVVGLKISDSYSDLDLF